jgi:hypothetical protein
MAWQNPSPLSGRVDTPHGLIVRLITALWLVVVTSVTIAGCGRQMPAGPATTAPITISGYVHAEGTFEAGEPTLSDVVVTVRDAEGSSRTSISNGLGFYSVSARSGTITITASKEGYTSRSASFDISADTVLNFSLTAVTVGR